MLLRHGALAVLLGLALSRVGAAQDDLFVAKPLTEENSFTNGIEGPACGPRGDVFAVNFARQQTIGRISADGRGEVFVTLPGQSVGNGIVFGRDGAMYVADYVGHNVLRVDPLTRQVRVFAHDDAMHQPNDLAIAPDCTLYASDPDWKNGTGQIWRINAAGKIDRVADGMGTTNGIEVSPDGKQLYVNETVQRNVWSFPIRTSGSLGDKRLVVHFDDFGMDGMRCDIDGNLYIARYGKGSIVKLSSEGKVLKEIGVLGDSPSNVCLGGPDGCTAYVTEVQHRRLVQFRIDRPGAAWERLRDMGHDRTLVEGDTIVLGGKKVSVTKLDALPLVDDQWTRRFKFDSYDNPKLKQLREQYRLDEVVAPGKDEFEKQFLLLDWVNHRFKKFGHPSSPARGALDILRDIDRGNSFFCSHYGDVFVSAAASMGWVDRGLALRRPDNIGSGSTEHTSTEIWSNQYRKWVLFDPTFAMYMEKDGVPLSAYEFRQEWFYHDGKDVTFVLDKDHKRYHKSDFPVLRGRYEGFGNLVLDGGATNVYAFIGYIPNTNWVDAGPDYGHMFITQDRVCDGTSWHKRDVPPDPAHDPYFPINQAALTLTPDGSSLRVSVKTLTPNFKTFQARIDGGDWKDTGDTLTWNLHEGSNRLDVKSVNQFGVDGPVSAVEANAAR